MNVSPDMLAVAPRKAAENAWRNLETIEVDVDSARLAPESVVGVLCCPSGSRNDRRGSMSGQNRYGCFDLVPDRREWFANELAGHGDHSLKPPPA